MEGDKDAKRIIREAEAGSFFFFLTMIICQFIYTLINFLNL